MVYDVYLLCELYLLSLKIFIFVSFQINKFLEICVCGRGRMSHMEWWKTMDSCKQSSF